MTHEAKFTNGRALSYGKNKVDRADWFGSKKAVTYCMHRYIIDNSQWTFFAWETSPKFR